MVDMTKTISPTISGASIARITGLSPQRVSVLLKRGQTAGEIIATAELRKAAREADQLPDAISVATGKAESLLSSKARKEGYLADLRLIELRHKRGELVPIAQVNTFFA